MRALVPGLVCAAAVAAMVASAPAQPAGPASDPDFELIPEPAAPDHELIPEPAAPDHELIPEPAAPDFEPLPEPAGSAAPHPRDDAAWSLYQGAFAALAAGRAEDARAALIDLLRDHADHPAARAGARALRALDTRGFVGGPGAAAPLHIEARGAHANAHANAGELPTNAARAELMVVQTLHGMLLGVEVCVVAECWSRRAIWGVPLLGGGLVLTAALGLSTNITPSRRALLNAGTVWGGINAGVLSSVAHRRADLEAGMLMLGHVGGLVVGELLWRTSPLTEGQVALANSTGMWSGMLAFLFLAAADTLDSSPTTSLLVVQAAANLGIATGGYLGGRYPEISRGRTLIIDAGGVAGTLGGLGLATLVGGDDTNGRVRAGAALAGGIAGLVAATYLSRHLDVRAGAPARVTLMPRTEGGLVAGLMLDLE